MNKKFNNLKKKNNDSLHLPYILIFKYTYIYELIVEFNASQKYQEKRNWLPVKPMITLALKTKSYVT